MSRDELESLTDTMRKVLSRLGVGDPETLSVLGEDWDAVAGPPWSGRSRPLLLREGTLVVEASTNSMVAFLRYAETDLLRSLAGRLGPGVVDSVEVRPPSRARG